MQKTRLKGALIFGITVGAILLLYIITSFTGSFIAFSQYNKINHFDHIDVCYAFDEYIIQQEKITDDYIRDIDFIDSYVHKLNYKGKEFTLYAYEFPSVEAAKDYYVRMEGDTVDGDIDYDGNSNPFSSNLITRYKTNVYRIETNGTRDYVEIMKYLNSVFTITIRD